MSRPKKVIAPKIEKGVFVKCGHLANIENTYRHNKVILCRVCKYRRSIENKKQSLSAKEEESDSK